MHQDYMPKQYKAAIFFRIGEDCLKEEAEIKNNLSELAHQKNIEIHAILLERICLLKKFKGGEREKTIFFKKKKNKKYKRSKYHELINMILNKKINIVIINKLADIGRTDYLKSFIGLVKQEGVDIISFKEMGMGLDTTLYQDKNLHNSYLSIIEILLGYDKDIRSEHIRASLKKLKENGELLGRKTKITQIHLERAKILRDAGITFKEISKKFGVHESTIRKKINN